MDQSNSTSSDDVETAMEDFSDFRDAETIELPSNYDGSGDVTPLDDIPEE